MPSTATALDVFAPRMSFHHLPLPAGGGRPSPPGGAATDLPSHGANPPGNQPISYPAGLLREMGWRFDGSGLRAVAVWENHFGG